MELRHDADPYRLHEPRYNLDMGCRAFARCAPRIYNKLPSDFKGRARIDIFKKKLKTYLFKEVYDFNGMEIKDNYRYQLLLREAVLSAASQWSGALNKYPK
ncbi:hypothetical protein E2C01_068494 [Portunus trituberculatus]|uniref:Uncharacterized protein n=1 Tax=Portunus trituberculatus TaxID=210409 RepID=A0A5B7HWA3_PORTR|nr:hypothetical protein [Portunus trituberculatus]